MSTIRIRVKRKDGITIVRTLIAHPMETGQRREKGGDAPIAAHFIQELTVEHNDRLIARAHLGAGISKDPYLSFRFKGGTSGDLIRISWIDNLGQRDSAERVIK